MHGWQPLAEEAHQDPKATWSQEQGIPGRALCAFKAAYPYGFTYLLRYGEDGDY